MTEPQKKRQIRTKPQEMFGRLGFVCLFVCLLAWLFVCLLGCLFVFLFVCFFPHIFVATFQNGFFTESTVAGGLHPWQRGEPLIVLRNDG